MYSTLKDDTHPAGYYLETSATVLLCKFILLLSLAATSRQHGALGPEVRYVNESMVRDPPLHCLCCKGVPGVTTQQYIKKRTPHHLYPHCQFTPRPVSLLVTSRPPCCSGRMCPARLHHSLWQPGKYTLPGPWFQHPIIYPRIFLSQQFHSKISSL